MERGAFRFFHGSAFEKSKAPAPAFLASLFKKEQTLFEQFHFSGLHIDFFPEWTFSSDQNAPPSKRLAVFITYKPTLREASPSLKEKVVIELKKQFSVTDVTWVDRPIGKSGVSEVLLGNGKPLISFEWMSENNPMCFEVRLQEVLHPGIFLDHHPLRKQLYKISKGKRILNLFAYTGCLGLSGALGGAKTVITVDLSKKTLDWAKRNFELNFKNNEETENSRFDFSALDAERFLKRSVKLNAAYDLVLIDPPSFSRGKEGTFQIKKDFPRLLELCFKSLSMEGILVASMNCEELSQSWLENQVATLGSLKILNKIQPAEEFRGTQASHLKGVVVQKEGEARLIKSRTKR